MNITHPLARMIIDYCRDYGVSLNQAAYILGTAHHETGGFKYLREIWGPTPAQKKYEGRADLGNTQPGDGKRFMGRGLVHITGRRNYADWSKRLGIDLVGNPALAEKPEIAVRILVEGMMLGTFTGRSLPSYVNATKSDYVNARRVVNGTDRAETIARYARGFEKLLQQAGYGQAPAPKPAQPPKTPAAEHWLSRLFKLILAIFRR